MIYAHPNRCGYLYGSFNRVASIGKLKDQVTIKGVWSDQANAELAKQLESKKQFIGLNGKNVRTGSNEAIQCLYSLTLLLPDSKHEKPVF